MADISPQLVRQKMSCPDCGRLVHVAVCHGMDVVVCTKINSVYLDSKI